MYCRELSSGLDVSNNCQSNSSLKHRITKSSTTCFNKENVNGSVNSNAHYQNMASNNSNTGYFGHSNSYDNMRALKNTSLIKDKDHANTNNNNISYTNNINSHVTPTSLNSSINNKSNCSSTSNSSDQIVLHVRNLDYKISADEWKRILLENFRKHCKEVNK